MRPPSGQPPSALAQTTSQTIPASRNIWCWPGCCSPKTTQPRRSPCCSGWPAPRPARAGPAASSRSRRCGRSRWPPAAITLARRPGYVRVFADEGAPMRALLAQLSAARQDQRPPARRIDPGYLAALTRACGQADAVLPPSRTIGAAPGLAEPLTGRELEVLRLLAAGKSNQRIAHDLVVALDTVKKHVTHVLGKLGAANRT